MRRRELVMLIGGAALCPLVAYPLVAWPRVASAQPAGKLRRVGIITGGMRSAAYDGFLQGMRALGYVAGQNYAVEWRIADGRYSQFAVFADELVRLKVDVIFLGTAAAVNPVRDITNTIPIVMGYSVDPVGNGFVKSLAHPGGNVTGLASSGEDTSARQLELLAAVVPGLKRVALLQNPDSADYARVLKSIQAAAQPAGIDLVAADAHNPQGIDNAFALFAERRVQAIKLVSDPLFLAEQQRLVGLVREQGLPSMFSQRDYVRAGGLMSYGESLKEFYRRAATFVDRIFKGERPGDLPIEQPTKFNLVINRKTADALGLAIPPQVSSVVDEVIE